MREAFIHIVTWLLTHTLYRVRVAGRENVPASGGALLVCNHLSFVDALLICSVCRRPVRFLMDQDHYARPWVRPFARLARAIPISSQAGPRALLRTLDEARQTVLAGGLVGIFAEGRITRTGQLQPFARGLERIMRGLDAAIVPLGLDGLWGSVFSFSKQRFFWKLPECPRGAVSVTFGRTLPATATAGEVRQAIAALLSAGEALGEARPVALLLREPPE